MASGGALGTTLRSREPRRRLLCILLLTASPLWQGCSGLRWPVDGRPSSGYGLRTRGIWPDIHHGVDFAVPEGTAVRAMARGRVRFAGAMSGYGNVVWLDHGRDVLSVYAHLSRIDVPAGGNVERGQILGTSGATGDVTAPHLHFEVWRWGRPVDPIPLMGGLPGS
jgi:murein DD-endopeptidase MepM/ murein hydrolase activator NlpD